MKSNDTNYLTNKEARAVYYTPAARVFYITKSGDRGAGVRFVRV